MLCPVETQYLANVAVVASSQSDTYRRMAIGIAQLLALLRGIFYVVAISTCETPPWDSPNTWLELCRILGLFPVAVSESVRAGKTQATNSHLLRLSLFSLSHLFLIN